MWRPLQWFGIFDSSLVINYRTFGSDRRKLVDNAYAAMRQWRHSSMTSISIDAQLRRSAEHINANFDSFWEFDPLNVFGHRADPKKALPCVIARNLSHSAYPSTDRFSRRIRGKINQNKKDRALYFTYLPRRSLRVDWHKFWVTCSSRGHNQLCTVLS